MNEITRIHLAKTPYEIEVPAKKHLTQYLKGLADYANDPEVIEDIEIRMTEILAARGVQSGGVIGLDDVEALRSQIGSPEEVAGDTTDEVESTGQRKLYRETDRGLVGGVVSGLAVYFRIDTVIARIIFIVLTFITSGFLLIIYVLMWFVVPATKTAADKLRLRGQPVTAESIAKVNSEDMTSFRRRGAVIRSALLYLAGIGALLGVVGSLLIIGLATISVFAEGLFDSSSTPPMWYVAYGLAVASGLLLATLFGLVAYASFRRDLSKRLMVAAVVLVVTGIVSFSVAVGFGVLGSWQSQQNLQSSIERSQVDLPNNFQDVTSVSFSSDDSTTIEYIVSDQPSMTLESTPGFKPKVEVNDGHADISLVSDGRHVGYVQSALVVSGPSLDRIVVDQGAVSYIAKGQDRLSMEVASEARATVTGAVDSLEVAAMAGSGLYLTSGAIGEVKLSLSHIVDVQIGNIGSLDIVYSDVCPAEGQRSALEINNVASKKISLNGQTKPLGSYDLPCLKLDYERGED